MLQQCKSICAICANKCIRSIQTVHILFYVCKQRIRLLQFGFDIKGKYSAALRFISLNIMEFAVFLNLESNRFHCSLF